MKKKYRKTEVGVIPEDWLLCTMKDICWINQGLQIAISRRSKYQGDRSKVYITIQYLNNAKVTEYINDYTSSVVCDRDDVLMTRTGNTGFVVTNTDGVFHNNFFKINFNREKIDKDYLVLYLTQPRVQKLILSKAGTSTIPDLNHTDFYSLPFVAPELKDEQKKISSLILDTQRLIEILDRFIDKKKSIKCGLMQELLTGKKRLPEFSKDWDGKFKKTDVGMIPSDWNINPLGDNFVFSGGFSASRDQLSGEGYCYLHYGDIHGSTKTYIDVDKDFSEIPKLNINLKEISQRSLLNDGDVVFVDASEDDEGTSRHIVVANPRGTPYISGLHTIVAKNIGNSIDNLFKRYCFQTSSIKRQFKFYSVGTKVSGISKTSIPKIFLGIPPTRDEQKAIAHILNDMDLEIMELYEKLEKYKRLKQGMMQNLLTGKIRLA